MDCHNLGIVSEMIRDCCSYCYNDHNLCLSTHLCKKLKNAISHLLIVIIMILKSSMKKFRLRL